MCSSTANAEALKKEGKLSTDIETRYRELADAYQRQEAALHAALDERDDLRIDCERLIDGRKGFPAVIRLLNDGVAVWRDMPDARIGRKVVLPHLCIPCPGLFDDGYDLQIVSEEYWAELADVYERYGKDGVFACITWGHETPARPEFAHREGFVRAAAECRWSMPDGCAKDGILPEGETPRSKMSLSEDDFDARVRRAALKHAMASDSTFERWKVVGDEVEVTFSAWSGGEYEWIMVIPLSDIHADADTL